MTKYRKKPVFVEAVVWDESRDTLSELSDRGLITMSYGGHRDRPDWVTDLRIKTSDGSTRIAKGEYIVKGPRGEFYRCRPDIFMANHEAVDE